MTTKEAISKLRDIKSQFEYECAKAARKRDKAIEGLLQQWANDYKHFDVGDFVIYNNSIIRIENIRPELSYGPQRLRIRYAGQKFTLNDQSLTNCSIRLSFYDEGDVVLFNPLLRKRKTIIGNSKAWK